MTSPYNFPVAGTDITSGSTAHVSLSAQVTYTTPQVLGLNANRRGCLYENESRSLGFPNYSHGNCIAQCHRHSTLLYCNCTPYFYPTEGVKLSSRGTIAVRNRRFFLDEWMQLDWSPQGDFAIEPLGSVTRSLVNS